MSNKPGTSQVKGLTHSQQIDQNLLHAVIEGDLEKVKYYTLQGADLHQIDGEGPNPTNFVSNNTRP